MTQTLRRRAISVAVEMWCRDKVVTLTLRHGERQRGYRPLGKDWRTLHRGDLVRGPGDFDYTVKRLTLEEAIPPLSQPIEIDSVAAWSATGLRR